MLVIRSLLVLERNTDVGNDVMLREIAIVVVLMVLRFLSCWEVHG